MHQAVVCPPVSRTAPVADLSNDYLHALYEDLMTLDTAATQTAGLEVSNESNDVLLAEYAERGNTQGFELLISRIPSAPPTEYQRDLHVKAHIVNASLSTHPSLHSTVQRFPTGALAILHQYEASGHFAPIRSYTRVISALFNRKRKLGIFFAHMRYVAHPVPDALLYALMIRACGSFSRPEPERALDLWMEMQENGVRPTKGAYEAIIRVCGRAGPEWLGEGMRLAREMSDRHSITGMNGRGLWCALLEGCKRSGDLKKARWILAEAVRGNGDGASSEGSMMDAELMTHMFHTYASYKPPFRRETTRLIDRTAASNGEVPTNETQVEEISSHSDPPSHLSTEQTRGHDVFPDVPVENVESMPSFSRLPPQTSSDVIAETRALFDRILQDRSLCLAEARNSTQGGLLVGRFAHVELTPVLLNAYLSVFYRHASIETSQEAFDSFFSQSDSSSAQKFHHDEHTYVNALERCAIARVEDRYIAARWAKDIWRRWELTEAKSLRDGKVNMGSFARLTEKAHAAMRRVLILSGDIDSAQALLRTFVSRYPPNAVLQSTESQPPSLDTSPVVMPAKSPSNSATVQLFAKPPILSTRTVLTNPVSSESLAARPLVRLTSVVSPTDDRVPPIIAFGDVDLLHARLAEHGRIKDVGYIKWYLSNLAITSQRPVMKVNLVAVEGCCHGALDAIYQQIKSLQDRNNYKVELLLICGDFQAARNHRDLQCVAVPEKYRQLGDFYKYYTGEKVAPVLTIVIGGNHEASNYFWELYHGGWLAPNIYFLGHAGCIQVNGVRIAGASGIFKNQDFNRGHHERMPYDHGSMRSIYHVREYNIRRLSLLSKPNIFLSHDWPRSIEQYGNTQGLLRKKPFFRQDIDSGKLGSPPFMGLLQTLRPDWWFSAHLHVRFEAVVKHGDGEQGPGEGNTPVVPTNPDEIVISDDDVDESSTTTEATLMSEVRPTTFQNPHGTTPVDDEELAEPVTRPVIPQSETKFIALDKCLPRRDFLEIIEIQVPHTASVLVEQTSPLLTYDPEWLAITRAFNQYFSTTRQQATYPDEPTARARVSAELEWVEENIFRKATNDGAKSPLSVDSCQVFVQTAPGFCEGNAKSQQPPRYSNPQTVAFCRMLGIDNKINHSSST
ncbi:hypothetical protein J3R83DRAFT_11348 [Lanmaoa asiatica]|nr:hypothetical protein J3R83DRAFT_11348 [Lanmaoa asiatica]